MSTVCKIVVGSERVPAVESILHAHLVEVHGWPVTVESSAWLMTQDDSVFLCEQVEATRFSLKEVLPDITEVHFNSFGYQEELATKLSRELNTKVVVLIYQSTAEAWYWSYFEDGKKLRCIEASDGALTHQEGAPLPFESQLGSPFSTKSCESKARFDGEILELYTQELGLQVGVFQESEPGWTTLSCRLSSLSRESTVKKPWWRIR